MKTSHFRVYIYGFVAASLMCLGVFRPGCVSVTDTPADSDQGVDDESQESGVSYRIQATNARLIREVQGSATAFVGTVPAEPVDAFAWDGGGVTTIEGTMTIEVDPVNNTGTIQADWQDEFGQWSLVQVAFSPPDHPSGVVIGASVAETGEVTADPITTNIYLHGDTSAGAPVLPTVFTLLATWGPAEVTLNGEPFENPFDGPAPLWVAHTMTTVGVRDRADGTVRTTSGDIYNMMLTPSEGLSDPNDLEVHLVFHDKDMPLTTNIPPIFSFFYHVQFEDVTIAITHRE